jgi:putative spermidine/putrescine transport system permease protein
VNHPAYSKAKGARPALLLSYPSLVILVLFLLPLLVMMALSFFKRIQSAFFEPAFVLENYQNALVPFFLERLAVSIGIAAFAAFLCLLIGFPFTFFLTRLRKRRQIPILVILISILSLSEVIIAFSWSLLLSKTSGISNLFVLLGLREESVSWSPGFTAMLSALVYIALPLACLVLYPSLSRLERDYTEAATTLGASPIVAFFTVVVPILRQAIISTFILVFIFVLGSYLIPQVLGRPEHWTLPVHITDQAILKSNLPLAAALAMILLVVSLGLSLLTLRLSGSDR